MLTKRQAKTFFIGGTVLFSGVFLWLTLDTVQRVRASPSALALSPQIVRGKQIWEENNCMGCHTLFGEGAYYAPELTRVVERRGEDWIRVFIKNPEAMYPGQRRMIHYNFSDPQIDDIIAFLRWCGTVDLNGFPAKPPLQMVQVPGGGASRTGAAAAVTRPAIFSSLCMACHMVGGQGGAVGPALDDAYTRKNREQMMAWIKDPQSIKPDTKMPKLPVSEQQIDEITDYLQSFREN